MMTVIYYASCLHFACTNQVFVFFLSQSICFQSLYIACFYLPVADVSCIGHELDVFCMMFPRNKQKHAVKCIYSFRSGVRNTA